MDAYQAHPAAEEVGHRQSCLPQERGSLHADAEQGEQPSPVKGHRCFGTRAGMGSYYEVRPGAACVADGKVLRGQRSGATQQQPERHRASQQPKHPAATPGGQALVPPE